MMCFYFAYAAGLSFLVGLVYLHLRVYLNETLWSQVEWADAILPYTLYRYYMIVSICTSAFLQPDYCNGKVNSWKKGENHKPDKHSMWHKTHHTVRLAPRNSKGTTINDLGVGPEEIEKKMFEGARPGKNKFQKALNFKRHCRGKNKFIFDFSSAPPPQIINGWPLNGT